MISQKKYSKKIIIKNLKKLHELKNYMSRNYMSWKIIWVETIWVEIIWNAIIWVEIIWNVTEPSVGPTFCDWLVILYHIWILALPTKRDKMIYGKNCAVEQFKCKKIIGHF